MSKVPRHASLSDINVFEKRPLMGQYLKFCPYLAEKFVHKIWFIMNKHSIKYFICFQTLRKQLHTRLKKLEVESQIAFDEMKTQNLFQTGLHGFGF